MTATRTPLIVRYIEHASMVLSSLPVQLLTDIRERNICKSKLQNHYPSRKWDRWEQILRLKLMLRSDLPALIHSFMDRDRCTKNEPARMRASSAIWSRMLRRVGVMLVSSTSHW